VAETLLVDQATQRDSMEQMAGHEPHFVSDLRSELDDEPEEVEEVIEDMDDSDMADIIDIGRRVAQASHDFTERRGPGD
jgi:predicted house-cleaning noncanonical NTP pyrophosphatase (MazG superfamily)